MELLNTMETMKRTRLGAALFGIGRDLCGVCPGPAISSLMLGTGH